MKNHRHESAPIFDDCLSFIKRKNAPFYCPGHKGGRTLEPEFRNLIAELDLNNLYELDNLHSPSKFILKAEELLADAYGVDKSFILVGGSTTGNIAAVMSTAGPGEKVLVPRNAHKSTIAGIIQAGATPVWLTPEWDTDFEIFQNLALSTIEEAFKTHPDSAGLFLLNPSYFGMVSDIVEIKALCKKAGKLLVVDEAHGAHLHFSDHFPIAAEDVGADMIIQSTHKMLSALSQAAVLHLNGSLIDEGRVRKTLYLTQTTSPNFAIMASIDLARRQMMLEGKIILQNLSNLTKYAREKLQSIPGLRISMPPIEKKKGSGFYDLDETKILIDVRELGLSGYEANRILNNDFAIQPELAGPSYVLCIMTVGSTQEDVDRLVTACSELTKRAAERVRSGNAFFNKEVMKFAGLGRELSTAPEICMLPREAFYAKSENLDISQCAGHISADIITPYPPGIPILMPGERISQPILDFLSLVNALGNPISSANPKLTKIRVVI